MEPLTDFQREVVSFALTDLSRKIDHEGWYNYLNQFGADYATDEATACGEALEQLLNTDPKKLFIEA